MTSSSRRCVSRALLGACFLLSAAAALGTQAIDEFPTPTPLCGTAGIVAGPDGNVWYTAALGLVGRITTQGAITEFTVRIGSDPHRITVGADGNLWFGETNGQIIGRITPSGAIKEFPTPLPNSQPLGVTTGPDGNVWFTESAGNKIGRISPAGVTTEFPLVFPQYGPGMIAAGSDGNLWFTLEEAFAPNSIGRITPFGVVTNFPLPSGVGPSDITAGPDGNVWFTEYSARRIGRITPSGVVTEYLLPLSAGSPSVITKGPDGNLWVGTATTIVVVSASGTALRAFSLPANVNGPSGIATGPDGNVWFTLPFAGDPAISLRSEVCRVNLAPAPATPEAPELASDGNRRLAVFRLSRIGMGFRRAVTRGEYRRKSNSFSRSTARRSVLGSLRHFIGREPRGIVAPVSSPR